MNEPASVLIAVFGYLHCVPVNFLTVKVSRFCDCVDFPMKHARRDKAFHRKTASPTVFPYGLHKQGLKPHTGFEVRFAFLKANWLFVWVPGYFVAITLYSAIYCEFCAAILVRAEN